MDLSFLTSQLHNQFVGGGLVLMLTGSVIALARRVPSEIAHWTKRRFTIEVEVLNSDPLFDYVTMWLDAQPYSKRSRRLTATTVNRGVTANEDDDDVPVSDAGTEKEKQQIRVFLSPSPGVHLFVYNGRPVWLERHRDEASPSATGTGKMTVLLKHETYRLTILGRNQAIARNLINEIVILGSRPKDNSVRLFTSGYSMWTSRGRLNPRGIESVILPDGIVESTLADIRLFLSSREYYHSLGIPWHRCYLLFGVPGSGKTSVACSIAGELQMDLYLLTLSGRNMDDDQLISLMGLRRPGSIVLMEDIDCAVPSREGDDKNDRVTLGGLLNCLDGVHTPDGCLIFMTTNHREMLDPALLRPGRVDVQIEFTNANEDQILRLRDRICPWLDNESVLSECRGRSMAEVQQNLLDRDRRFPPASVTIDTKREILI